MLNWSFTSAVFNASLRKVASKFPDEVARALYVETEIDTTEAKKRTPVAPDGGELRASVRTEGPFREGPQGRTIYTLIVAGGGTTSAYAITVHEHLSKYSPPSWVSAESRGGIHWNVEGTGPKFIESVVLESRPHMGARVAARIELNRCL